MPQLTTSAQTRAFYRHTFEIKDKGVSVYRHTLLVNPDDMTVEEPHRATVTQTLGGAYLSRFGQGLHNISISGKTGFSARRNADGAITDGYEEIKNLRKRVYRDFINSTSAQYEMFWYDWENEEYYKVFPLSLRVQRSTSLGLMYRYELQFTCLESLANQTKPKTDNLLSAVDALTQGLALSTASSSLSETLFAFSGGAS